MEEHLLTTEQAADYMGLRPATLETWRWSRGSDGPPYVRLSRRAVRYRRSDLDAWLRENTVNAGSAA